MLSQRHTKKILIAFFAIIIVIPSLLTGIAQASTTVSLTDGFENGFSSWTGRVGNAAVVSNIMHSGGHSLQSSSSFSMAYKDLPYVSEATLEFYVRFDSRMYTSGTEIVVGGFMQRNWNWLYTVGLGNVGGKIYWMGINGNSHSASRIMTNPSANTWYRVQMQVRCGSSNNGEIRVYINGVELTDLRQTSTNTVEKTISRASVGMIYGRGWSSTNSMFIDDVKLGTDALSSAPAPATAPASVPVSSYTAPAATPAPSTTTPTPSYSTSNLQLTGLGCDYTGFYNDGPAEQWIRSDMTTKLVQYRPEGYTASRLGFEFGRSTDMSTLDYNNFDRVLQIFNSKSIKVIPVAWDDQTLKSAFLTSHKSNWLKFVSYYKGDTRIAAIALFNEPTKKILSASMNRAQFQQYAADLVRAIHAIDPNRVCIFPIPMYMYGTFSEWLKDLKATGIMSEPNVVFDIVHPYFMENDYDRGMSPEQLAAWYGSAWMAPAVATFGNKRVWAGETFAWAGAPTIGTTNYPSHMPNIELQKRWLVAIIKEYNKRGVSYCIWASLLGQKWTLFVEAEKQIN